MTQVVAALIWSGDKFMICQRPAHKTRGLLWEFVGGKVEPGETKEAALIRGVPGGAGRHGVCGPASFWRSPTPTPISPST